MELLWTTQSGGVATAKFSRLQRGRVYVLYSFDSNHGAGLALHWYKATMEASMAQLQVAELWTAAWCSRSLQPSSHRALQLQRQARCRGWKVSVRWPDSGQRWIFLWRDFEGGTNGFGTLYKITPTGSYSILYNFVSGEVDRVRRPRYGNTPAKFYGLANAGGANSLGAIFSFDVGLKPFIATLPTSGKVAKAVGILAAG